MKITIAYIDEEQAAANGAMYMLEPPQIAI